MTDVRGLFEHAQDTEPRREHGYCTDDNARLLVLLAQEPASGTTSRLSRTALNFVLAAQDQDGSCRNRMDTYGRWTDQPTTDDCWGRSLWGLGSTATAKEIDPILRRRAHHGFNIGSRQRSTSVRAMVFATFGAAEILTQQPSHQTARDIISQTIAMIGPIPSGSWKWPEERLRYANAALAEALIIAGSVLELPEQLDKGLAMLDWLLSLETRDGHLSVTGSMGRGPQDTQSQFDQQPIEVAAMAQACSRALQLTGDSKWGIGVALAAKWFMGTNDVGLVMYDPISGGGFDGLQVDRVNKNQGAESTLAFLTTMQRSAALAAA